eukprot:scaffold323_cov414-Prasinococcus_capsulatus_cf.AAC.47
MLFADRPNCTPRAPPAPRLPASRSAAAAAAAAAAAPRRGGLHGPRVCPPPRRREAERLRKRPAARRGSRDSAAGQERTIADGHLAGGGQALSTLD